MKTKRVDLLVIVIGVIVLLTPYFIAPVCQGLLELKIGTFMYMKCHYTAQVELLFGVLLAITGFLAHKMGNSRTLGVMIVCLGVFVVLIPQQWVIGVCMKDTMPCRTTLVWLTVEGIVAALAGLWLLVRGEGNA